MPSIVRHGAKWRAHIRLKGQPPRSRIFTTKAAALAWARQAEAEVPKVASRVTVEDLVAAFIRARRPSRTVRHVVENIRAELGRYRIGEVNQRIVQNFALRRPAQGATVQRDVSLLRAVLTSGGVMLSVDVSGAVEAVRGARRALKLAGQLDAGQERSRRPTEAELAQLRDYLASSRYKTPLWELTLFAIATAMRLGEICRITWEDYNPAEKTIVIRQRKHPTRATDEIVPLLTHARVLGEVVDPVAVAASVTPERKGRMFPFPDNSVSHVWGVAVRKAGITNLHFHDLRHDAVSRLFELGLTIEQVAMVSGHKDWRSLRRYTNLRPGSLHAIVQKNLAK